MAKYKLGTMISEPNYYNNSRQFTASIVEDIPEESVCLYIIADITTDDQKMKYKEKIRAIIDMLNQREQ